MSVEPEPDDEPVYAALQDVEWQWPLRQITGGIRRQLPRLSPMEITAAAKLLHVLERLPRVTHGIYVEAEVDHPANRRQSWVIATEDGHLTICTRVLLEDSYDAGEIVLRLSPTGRDSSGEKVDMFDANDLLNWINDWERYVNDQRGLCYDSAEDSILDDGTAENR